MERPLSKRQLSLIANVTITQMHLKSLEITNQKDILTPKHFVVSDNESDEE